MTKFRPIGASVPVSVAQEVAHWKQQHADNPLWGDAERDIIMSLVQRIEGKRKADAVALLQEYIRGRDGVSMEATFARCFVRHLREGTSALTASRLSN